MSNKFSDETCEKLYELSLHGGPDEEYGSVTEAPGRWWGIMIKVTSAEMIELGCDPDELGPDYPLHVILTEDSQGFVDYETYATAEEAQENFARIIQEIEAEIESVNA